MRNAWIAMGLVACADARTEVDAEVDARVDTVVAPASCEAPRLELGATIEGVTPQQLASGDITITGTVVAADYPRFVIATAEGDVSVDYAFGHVVPVSVGTEVVLRWVQLGPTFTATGFALTTLDGDVIALADLGPAGSVWNGVRGHRELPGGFEVEPVALGCAPVGEGCGAFERLGLRLTHGSQELLVEPGGEAVLEVEDARFHVVEAFTARLPRDGTVCLDQFDSLSWLVLREPAVCDDPPSLIVSASIDGALPDLPFGVHRFEVEGTVTSVGEHRLELDTADGPVTLDYGLGPHRLPVEVDDPVTLLWVAAGFELQAKGFALLTPEGRALAIVDTGAFGSAWYQDVVPDEPIMPDGFEVRVRPIGCSSIVGECVSSERRALRFTRGTQSVDLPPGGAGELVGDDGARYRVIDAHTEQNTTPGEKVCSDQFSRVSWLVLAMP